MNAHITHCYQGEYEGSCKYGDEDCPARFVAPALARKALAESRYFSDDEAPFSGQVFDGDNRLLLIGGGASRSRQVLTLPFQNDPARLARILSGCDALVHANPFETLGLVVLEAMACGVPVVGVAHGGVGETVDETFGQLAARATPEAMAEAIAALFDRDLSVLGARARARAVERYRWDTTFEHLTQLYHRLTGLPAFTNSPASAP